MYKFLIILCIGFATIRIAYSQERQNYLIVIDQIGNLESDHDPKCYATAARMEDLIYGTPFSEEARFHKNYLQKQLVYELMITATKNAKESGSSQIKLEHFIPIFNGLVHYREDENKDLDILLYNSEQIKIKKNDLRQYSSIAYAYRAILAVQQDLILNNPNQLFDLHESSLEGLKTFIDIFTLSVIQLADVQSRLKDEYKINKDLFTEIWYSLLPKLDHIEKVIAHQKNQTYNTNSSQYKVLKNIVHQKIKSYEAYNHISNSVFLRNIQVYFARHKWPVDSLESRNLKIVFADAMIYFINDVLKSAEKKSLDLGLNTIRLESIHEVVQKIIPHRVNAYEDVIFFPWLDSDEQIILESYDLDAFRDSGIHWQYLGSAIEDPNFKLQLEPDPFASELLVESVAQIGVLVLRIAGDIAKERNELRLNHLHIGESLKRIQAKINAHAAIPKEDKAREKLVSSPLSNMEESTDQFFNDVTSFSGINFMHKSSDWLSRLIRSYVVKSEEKLARLAIPPAFGGSGIAAEDINNDGLVDVLILGGLGNHLYQNIGGGKFIDMTAKAGLNWVRTEDNNPGEPRQPIIADFNNDGNPDIFISYVNDDHRLYAGKGNGTFEDITGKAALGGKNLVAGPATAFDYDNDGLLDLYIGYFGDYIHGELPTLARDNMNGLPNRLFRNVGNFQFKDVTLGSGVDNIGWTQALGHSDFNKDGLQDLIVGNDFGYNAYYQNTGNGRFIEVSSTLATDKPSFTMNVGIVDLNRDQYPDFYISNIVVMEKDEKYIFPDAETTMPFSPETMANMRISEANDLFLSREKDNQLIGYELSNLVGRGYSSTGWAWDADFFDFDNDGDEDLYCVNGMNDFRVYSSDNPYYTDPDGLAKNVVFAESSKESNVMFENAGGKLQNRSIQSGANLMGNSRSAVYLDFDLDGDLDIILNNYHSHAHIYRNNSETIEHNWIKVKLVGDTEKNVNRDAIGAVLLANSKNHENIWREVHSTDGYLSSHPKIQHFGVGTDKYVDLKVIWPNGDISQFSNLDVNHSFIIFQKNNEVKDYND